MFVRMSGETENRIKTAMKVKWQIMHEIKQSKINIFKYLYC